MLFLRKHGKRTTTNKRHEEQKMNENIKNIGRAALLLNEAKKILDDTPEAITAGGLWGKVDRLMRLLYDFFMASCEEP